MSRLRQVLLAIVAICGLAVATAATATASTAPEQEQHCVESASTGSIDCFDTLAESLSVATGGAVNLTAATAENLSQADLDRLLNPISPQASYVHAILWTGKSGTGSSLTFTSSHLCGTTGWATWTYFQPPWNNNFESGHTYSGCKMRLYDGNTAAGSPSYLIGTDAMVNSFASFNNQASSARSCGSALACV